MVNGDPAHYIWGCVMDARRSKRIESDAVRAEIRVWMARRGVSGRDLATKLGHAPSWVSKRIGAGATVLLTVDDLYEIGEALDVPPVAFIESPGVPSLTYSGTTDMRPKRYQSGTMVAGEGIPFLVAA